MTRAPCCEKSEVKKGPWTPEEDELLVRCIDKYGEGNWSSVPKKAGLIRCGKSCRLRWANYLRPDLKRGTFTEEEEDLIIALHKEMGNRWAKIALELPGRTDNDIKNHWNTRIKKRLRDQGICPETHQPLPPTPEGGKQKPGTRKRHAAGEGHASATKRTVITPEVGPITLLHMPSEEEILHKFGLAMQAYWQSQANPGCTDAGSPPTGCLSPTGLPHVFFDPTGGFGPMTNQGGCTSASAQAAAAEAATAAAELLCSSLQPRLAANGTPSAAPSLAAAAATVAGTPKVCHEACCRVGSCPQLTPASPSKDCGDCSFDGSGENFCNGGAMVPCKTTEHSQAAANQRCMDGTPAEDEESVGESRELALPGTPGKLPAGKTTSAMLEDNHGSFSSLSGSPTGVLTPGSADSPLSHSPSARSSHIHALNNSATFAAPGTPQSAPGASAGLRQSFHRCAESLQAMGRGPTSGVPVVQPSLFMAPQEGQDQVEVKGECATEGHRAMPQGSCSGAQPAHQGGAAAAGSGAGAGVGTGGHGVSNCGKQAPGAGLGHTGDSGSGVVEQDVAGGSSYARLQLQIPGHGHTKGLASPFLLHQSSDASEVDLWTPGGEGGDLWSSDEDIDMAAMVLISPSGPGSHDLDCLSSLLSPKAVPASVFHNSGSNPSSAGGSILGGSNSAVADDMNCFNNLGDITPFDHTPSSPAEGEGIKGDAAVEERQGRGSGNGKAVGMARACQGSSGEMQVFDDMLTVAFPDSHCLQPAMMTVQ